MTSTKEALVKLIRFNLAYKYNCLFPESIPERGYVETKDGTFKFITFSLCGNDAANFEEIAKELLRNIDTFLERVSLLQILKSPVGLFFNKLLVRSIHIDYCIENQKTVTIRLTPNIRLEYFEDLLKDIKAYKKEGMPANSIG